MDKDNIISTIADFLAGSESYEAWDRQQWMEVHGEWASSEWDDDDDHIAEGLIDPDGVSDDAQDLGVGRAWEAWNCREGWGAYRVGRALYMRWWRAPYGGTNRHERDLYVLIDEDFFEAEAALEAAVAWLGEHVDYATWERLVGAQTQEEFARIALDEGESIQEAWEDYVRDAEAALH